jgi:hypothetical protein
MKERDKDKRGIKKYMFGGNQGINKAQEFRSE